jgi:hypothetical protein
MTLQKKKAKESEAKLRNPPKTSNKAVTVHDIKKKDKLTVEELSGGGGGRSK